MTTFIIRRLIQGIVVLFAATFLIYSILIKSPGGPEDYVRSLVISAQAGKPVNEKIKDYYIKLYGLDKGYPLNYFLWLFDPNDTEVHTYDLQGNPTITTKGINLFGVIKGSGVLTGDLGESVSFDQGKTTTELMGQRLLNTLLLTGMAQLVAILIALPIGIISAVRQYSRLDYSVTAFSFLGLSMPSFWLGLMLIITMAILPKQIHDRGLDFLFIHLDSAPWLPYFPPGDTYNGIENEGNIMNRLYHLVLPVTVLSFISIAGLSRYVRASMLEVLRQDYVRTAWAKGLQQRIVILKHALRNALIPVITIITLGLPGLFAGAIITETVFNYFGMGRLYIQAITVEPIDIPLAMGFLLISVTLIILSNILADVLYAITDPRIRFS
jgi:peptide/nickel transport system permease protein